MISIVVGGQYGSEAKGKAAVHLAKRDGCSLAVRTGSINAGHVAYINGHRHVCRMLPSLVAVQGVILALGPGAMISIPKLMEEVKTIEEDYGVEVKSRLIIDPEAAIMPDDAPDKELTELELGSRLGSTQTGCGWAQAQRCLRRVRFAKDINQLCQDFTVAGVPEAIYKHSKSGKHVIIEGTQGFGLSLFHGRHGQFCTSRDTSAAGFASEAGVGVSLVDKVVMVIRTWPIRINGNSGPMFDEVDWDTVRNESGYPNDITEKTSVTKKVRRVGRFDWGMLERACMVNCPKEIAIHGLDYLDYTDKRALSEGELSHRSKRFIRRVNDVVFGICRGRVTMAFNGPKQEDVINIWEMH